MSAITLKKIAQSLNLSISTVSRALKNHPDIAKSTIDRVKEIAEALDYEPNANAISLKKQDSKLFAVLVPTISNGFYASFISALEEECRKNDYNVIILQNADDAEKEVKNLKLCRHNRVTGVFACLSSNTEHFKEYYKLLENKIPTLFFDKVPDDAKFNKITINDELAATMAARHLTNKKSKQILALVGNENLSITKRRQQAFNNAVNSKTTVVYENALSSANAEEITTNYLLKNTIDSIFCMSDEILTGTMISIQKNNPSKKIEIICMSDGYFPNLYYPNISYVETSGYKLAKQAYSIMQNLMTEKLPEEEYFVEPTLYIAE